MFVPVSAFFILLSATTEALSLRNLDDGLLLNRAATATCLNAKALQTGSESNGQETPVSGQVASATDAANFINFCSGQTLTNGLQVKGGSCNGIVMGKIPSTSNMISAVFVSPKPGQNIAANTDFTVSVQVTGLSAGAFTNAASTYYAAPQDLTSSGQIIGHTHITVQDFGKSLTPSSPPDPSTFVFFKGINDAGNGKGLLSATVTGGLPAGNYRVCSMTSSSNHQPVLMPVAQRGAQDDCQKFTVGSGSSSGGSSTTTTSSSSAATSASSSSKSLGGIDAPAITSSGDSSRPFTVSGNTFTSKADAQQRACSIQNNACANAVNSGLSSGFTVSDCSTQEQTCNSS